MTIALRQSTASQEVLLGPFVDSTDGVTAETGLTIANTDIKIHKAGATTLASKNSGGATHISNGNYYAVLDATDTDTVGSGAIVVQVSGALAFRLNFHVYEEAVYDALYAASAPGYVANAPVNVAQFGGSNGTFASGRPAVNTSHIAGSAVSTSSAQIGVNVVNAGATAWNSGAIKTTTFTAGAIDAAAIAADAIGASELAADAATEIGTAVWATAARTLTAATNITSTGGTTVPQTGDSYARLGAPDGASVSADIAAVNGLINGLPFDTITGALEGLVPVSATVVGGTGNDTTHVHLSTLTYGDDEINSMLLVILDASTSEYHSRWIEDWVASTKLATVATLPFTPTAGDFDSYWLLPIRADVTGGSGLDAAGVRAAIGLASANLDTQLDALPTAAENADAVWDEALSGHSTAGSGGKALSDIDTHTDTEIAAIKAKTDNLPSDPADASDIASSFSTVNSTLSTIAGYLDTEVAAILADTNELQTDLTNGGRLDLLIDAIKAKTDNLPSDPADASDIATSFTTVNSKLDAIDDYIDTEVAAIKAKTDLIPAAPAAVGDIPTAVQNADALLGRNIAGGSSTGRTVKQALRALRNKVTRSGGTITVFQEDDTTSDWTASYTTDDTAEPIVTVDPS